MFTAITVTRTLLHVFTYMEWARNPALYAVNVGWLNLFFPAAKQGGVLHVFAKRRLYLGFSILTAVIALIFIAGTPFGHGLKPGIDFTGGSVVEAAFRTPGVSEAREAELRGEVTKALDESGIKEATVSIGRSEQPWTRVSMEATDVDEASKTTIRERLEGLTTYGFDRDSYKAELKDKTYKVDSVFTSPIAEADIRKALDGIVLKGLKITSTTEPHAGREAAIPVALVQSRHLDPQELQELKKKFAGIAGGIVLPMYQESSIGPSVAKEVTINAFSSVLVASLFIIIYLSLRFAIGGFMNGLKFGVSAVIALVHDVGIVIGIFALMGALRGWQIDSLFVTAALTVLGFSVHDTIVVYDRIRENLRHRLKGETFADVSDRSITQTFDRSINTSFTVLLVVAALAFFGGESIRLFNVALLIGIAIGTYSSIFVASPLVVLWERMSAARSGQVTPAAPTSRPTAPARPRPTPATPSRPAAAAAGPTGDSGGAGSDSGAAKPTGTGRVAPRKKRRL
jgi:preprotein translocase SecF subunit